MKQRMRIVIAVLVGISLVVAVTLVVRGPAAEADVLTASGTVEATETDLSFQVAGRVEEVTPQEGDRVRTGQEVAHLDRSDLLAALSAARAQADAARARLDELRRGSRRQDIRRAEAALRAALERESDARRDAERARRLYEGGAVSRQARDKAVTALAVATAARRQAEETLALVRAGPRKETIRAQEALVRQAEAQVERAEAALSHAVIVAPLNGIVTVRHREPGETIPAGAPVITVLDPDDRWVRIYVREDVIGRVRLGQPTTITADTYPGRVYHGRVIFIGSEAEFTPRNVQTQEERTKLVYPVKVRITGDDAFELKPGIPADVSLDARGAPGSSEGVPSPNVDDAG